MPNPIPLSFSSGTTEETLSGLAYDITQTGDSTVTLHFTAPSVLLRDHANAVDDPPGSPTQTLTFDTATLQGTNSFDGIVGTFFGGASGTFRGEELDNNGTFTDTVSVVTIDTQTLGGQGMFFIDDSVLTLNVIGNNNSVTTSTSTSTTSSNMSSGPNNTAIATQTTSASSSNVNVQATNESGVTTGQTFKVLDGTLNIDFPNAFHGNIVAEAPAPGSVLTTLPFDVFLKGIQADAYDFNGSTLRLFKANQVLDSVAFTNKSGGPFVVFQRTDGIDITNEGLGIPLPVHP